MKYITTDELKQITAEGLVLQGCGGNPDEWLAGINELLTEVGILRDGDTFKDAYVFEHDRLTNILFNMEDVKLDIGKLAMWRLQTHDNFGGTWLSDYLSNRLGVEWDTREPVNGDAIMDNDEPEEEAPPIVAFGERPSPYSDGFHSDGPHPDDRENATAHHPLRVYIENARDERLGGFTMPLAATPEDMRPFLDDIEIKSQRDMKVWEVLSDIDGLGEAVTKAIYDSTPQDALNEVNYLAAKINAMQPTEYEIFAAAPEAKRHCGSVAQLINLTENISISDIQPAYNAEQYGEFLIETAKDNTPAVFGKLEQSEYLDERALSLYILRLEAYVDAAAYRRGIAQEENGVFTERGYLTEHGEFKDVYNGPDDIPAESRVFSLPVSEPLMKVENADLCDLVLKIHALGGDYMFDARYNLNVLADKRSAEYLMLMNGRNIFLTEAAHAYLHGTEAFDAFMNTPEGPDTRVFAIHVTDVQNGSSRGDVVEVSFAERQLDILQNSIHFTHVDSTPKYGPDQSFTPEEWNKLESIDRHKLEGWTWHFDSGDQQAVIRHLDDLRGQDEQSGKAVDPDEFLADLNRRYMEKAQNPQTDMLRVTLTAAKEILARGDADVYRLLPEGPEKLQPLDAVKSNGLWYQQYREFAVKREDAVGLDKWAKRETDALVRCQPDKLKSHEQEL